jgi:adenylate cyclase
MDPSEGERRLVAILSADAAGYSRLMGADEAATVRTLTACRDLFKAAVAGHHGRVVDTAGDSVLAVFDSVVEAVDCAAEVQHALGDHNAELPEERRMHFRIGVNLGDVIARADGTIYGDGVNIAARLESLAEPGGITVSGSVYDSVAGKLDLSFESLGEQTVKNIARPVRAYRVGGGAAVDTVPVSEHPALPNRPSIAVLPFANMSGDPDQEYFADGIAEDLITALSGLHGLFVTARNSTFTYKGQAVDVKQVGADLGVRYVLEGSVRKGGNRVRVTAQLIDGGTGNHVWAQRYDRDLDDIFAVQDEVSRHVAEALRVALAPGERERLAHVPTRNIAAYDLYLRLRATPWPPIRSNVLTARNAYGRVIDMEPNFAGGHAGKSFALSLSVMFGHSDDAEADSRIALELAERAIALDDGFAGSFSALGTAYSILGRHDEAVAAARRAVEMQPGDADSHAHLGRCLMLAGEGDAAAEAIRTALRLDPLFVAGPYLNLLGRAYFVAGRYEKTIESYIRNRERGGPSAWNAYANWVAAYGHLGRIEEARELAEIARDYLSDFSPEGVRALRTYLSDAEFENLIEGFRKAGLTE